MSPKGPYRFTHDVLPVAVHDAKLASLHRHLGDDVRRAEDGLKVEPSNLTLDQGVEDVLDVHQLVLPLLGKKELDHKILINELN